MIIDIHSHFPWAPEYPRPQDVDVFVRRAERFGVDRLCLSGNVVLHGPNPTARQVREINGWTVRAMARHPERIVGLCFLNPLAGADAVRREIDWLAHKARARTRKGKARVDEAGRIAGELDDLRSRTASRTAGIEVAGSRARHSRVKSSPIVRIFSGVPRSSASNTKSSDQTAPGASADGAIRSTAWPFRRLRESRGTCSRSSLQSRCTHFRSIVRPFRRNAFHALRKPHRGRFAAKRRSSSRTETFRSGRG